VALEGTLTLYSPATLYSLHGRIQLAGGSDFLASQRLCFVETLYAVTACSWHSLFCHRRNDAQIRDDMQTG
jgi:hypothetical protein